ncbi:acyltransferase family protein [Aquabacterium sp. UBA2148]|uniref:acyltransferase family protein n=1 Tax=Aquabacterium sp. UBA2148 TaxID=1946042 RepID=UPI002580A575|nr:acyltransferase [Aquabacterium sp. UBA2148]
MHNRLAHLDGLRGLAALLVLYQHLVEYLVKPATAWPWLSEHLVFLHGVIDLGKVGVVAFFLISGFIVPYSYREPGAVGRFASSRFFRLYPAYWLSLLLAVLCLPHLKDVSFTLPQVLANLTMLPKVLGHKEALGVYWTLFVELVFYATTVVVFMLGGLRSLRWCVALVVIFCALALVGAGLRAQGRSGAPVTLLLYLAYMWFGACCRLCFLERLPGACRVVACLLAALLVITPLVWGIAFDDASHTESVLAAVLGCLGGVVLFLWCVSRQVLVHPFWLRAGALSYSVYLFHPIGLDLGMALGTAIAGDVFVVHLLAQVAVTLGFTWAVADLAKRWIEDPAIEVGRRFGDRLWGTKAASLNMAGRVKS